MAWGLRWFKPSETAGTFLRGNAEFVPFPRRSSRPFRAVCLTGRLRTSQSSSSIGPTTRTTRHTTLIAEFTSRLRMNVTHDPTSKQPHRFWSARKPRRRNQFHREGASSPKDCLHQTTNADPDPMGEGAYSGSLESPAIRVTSNHPQHVSPRITRNTGNTNATLPAIHEAARQSDC